MKKPYVVCLTLLGLLVSVSSLSHAQSAGTGQLLGTVRDPSGAVVAGAEVTIRNVNTDAARKFTTSETGLYTSPYLQPGRYEVRARKEGFAEVVRQNLRLEVGQTLTVDIDLPLKAAQQTVTVTTEVPLVETDKTEVSQTISQDLVENLPLNGRKWENLALLSPGLSEDGGFGGISFRGISSLYNNNMVDGADNNQAFFSEARGRTRLNYEYSMNAIKEFTVTAAAYSAEYGRAAGGVVNAVTKSGTNDWHGDLFYFIRDRALLARDAFINATQIVNPATQTLITGFKPEERRQQFGGSLGGPLKKDKLFFFLNYDQQKRNFPIVAIPITKNFFDATNPASQVGNCVARAASFGVTAANCLAVANAYLPIASTTYSRKGDEEVGLAKLDYQVNSNNRISGVFNILRWNSPNGIFTSATGPAQSVNGPDIVEAEFLTATWNAVWKPTVVNEARFQYGRDFETEPANHSGPGVNLVSPFTRAFGMPDFLPRGAFPDEKRFQWTDNVSWVNGRHQWKFGVDINYVRENIQNLFQGGGIYTYPGPNAFANLVRDLTVAGSRRYSSFTQAVDPIAGSGKGFFTTTDYNAYVQDTIKWRPNLSIYLGLRYEIQAMPGVVKANPLVPESAKLNTDKNNFGPRVGFSWGIGKGQKQVVRGGYGLYYGRTQNSSIFVHLFQNGVFQQAFTFSPAACRAPTFPNLVFPQPSTAPAFSPIFGTSGPTPTNNFASLAAFRAVCPVSGAAVPETLDPKFVNPLVHQYDIAYERELPWRMSLTVNYVGSRGNHLPVFLDVNLPPPNTTRTYLVFDGAGNPFTPSQITVPFFALSATNPRPRAAQGVTGPLLMGKSIVNSWYNGLVIRWRRRESHGLSFDANFTLSKAIDDGQVAGVNGTFFGTVSPLNPFNLRDEYGNSEIDIRKRFVASIDWQTPFGKMTQNAFLKQLVGDWRLSSIWKIQDGRPVTASLSGSPSCGSADFSLTCGAISAFGGFTSGRTPFIKRNTIFVSPKIVNFDLRVSRDFKVTERTQVEFIWEAFNLFNHTNFVPGFGIFGVQDAAFDFISATTGTITGTSRSCSASGAGVPGFNGCLVAHSPPHTAASDAFLAVRSTSNTLFTARQIQLALKLRF